MLSVPACRKYEVENTTLRIPGDVKRWKMQRRIPVRYTPSAMNPRPKLCFQYSMLLCAVVSSIVCASILAQAAAAPSRAAAAVDAMPHAKKIDEVALSPDGSRVAYVVGGNLKIIRTSGGSSQTIAVEGNLVLRGVAWSSDSKHLA